MPAREPVSPGRTSGRMLIVAVSAGIAALGVLAILLWQGLAPEGVRRPPPPRAQPASPTLPEWAPAEQLVLPSALEKFPEPDAGRKPPALVPEAETVDLFSGPAPELISRGHEIVDSGGRLHSKRVKELYELGKQSPGDARPHVILALDSMNRGWYGFAVGHYQRAVEENPEAAKDPRVMRDLLNMAGRRHHAEKAQAAVASIYGPTALPAVRAAIEEAMAEGDAKRAGYLEELAQSLGESDPP
jgi:hypothetical protein